MYFDEEPYYEPTPADEIFIDATNKLKEALKQSIKYQVDKIGEENEKLKITNEKLLKKVNEIASRERNLVREKNEYERTLKSKRLDELFGDRTVSMYSVTYHNEYSEKCNKCDENRKINFKSPSGKDVQEDCSCKISYAIHEPEEMILTELRQSRGELSMWYQPYRDGNDDGYVSSTHTNKKDIYSNQSYESIESIWKILFRTKEDCQGYCDYLNRSDPKTERVQYKKEAKKAAKKRR